MRANQSATLQWTANTATNVAGYALYIGTNSGNYESRIDVGTNIMATVSGLTNGMTFYFVTTAYDSADVESTPSNEAQFASPTNNPPALGSITNFNMPALGTLLITNTASDAIKSDKLVYSLDASPTNMEIDASSGVLEWMAPLSYAGTTNTVTVRVSDSVLTNETAIQTFTVVVSNYVSMSFGPSVVPLGQTNTMPLEINSSVGMTNVSFALDLPYKRMTNITVTSLATNVTATLLTNSPGLYTITFKAGSGQMINGPLTIARLNYKAVTNTGLPSCFAPLHATKIAATEFNGVAIPTSINGLGEAVLIGSQALVQSALAVNGQQMLTVYGSTGTNYQLQSRMGLTGTWTNEPVAATIMPSTLSATWSNAPAPVSGKYYRVHAQ